jgi:hypothetical protein
VRVYHSYIFGNLFLFTSNSLSKNSGPETSIDRGIQWTKHLVNCNLNLVNINVPGFSYRAYYAELYIRNGNREVACTW